jgi:sugar phosphate isomerase/epimerase
MNLAIGYVAADVEGLPPTQLVQSLRTIGYDAVDWTMEQFDPLTDGSQRLVELVALARGADLSVPQLMVHQDYVTGRPSTWEERVRRTERAIDAAAAAGVASVGVVTGPNRWVGGWSADDAELDRDAAWSLVLRALTRILDHAAGTGVTVALEPCWGTLAWDAASTDELLLQLRRDDLKLNFDPSHFVMSRDDAAALVSQWGERIAHVHLKDAFGVTGAEGEDFCFLLPGEGRTDWGAVFTALDQIHYTGAMSVEFESFTLRDNVFGNDVEAGARIAHQFVRGVLGRHAPESPPDPVSK